MLEITFMSNVLQALFIVFLLLFVCFNLSSLLSFVACRDLIYVRFTYNQLRNNYQIFEYMGEESVPMSRIYLKHKSINKVNSIYQSGVVSISLKNGRFSSVEIIKPNGSSRFLKVHQHFYSHSLCLHFTYIGYINLINTSRK